MIRIEVESMNILVCIKQVPDTTEIKIDPEKHTLIRDGVPSIVNTFDTYALEMACRLKEETGGTVTVMTMGLPQAKKALKSCLAAGADQAVLISDRPFGGSDTLATSYIISQAVACVEKEKGSVFDLILCGKQAIDGDTAQVGPGLSEHLGRPLITYVSELKYEEAEFQGKRENDDGYDWIGVKGPCVMTVVKTAYEPRYPTLKAKIEAEWAQIQTITAESMKETLDLSKCGLKGSPTKVVRTTTPENKVKCIYIKEASPALSAGKLADILAQKKVMGR